MTELEWAYKVLKGEIDAEQSKFNLAKAVAAYAIGEVLGKERGCMYCEEEVHAISENNTYFIIRGNMLLFFSEGKVISEFRIRRCPVCGKRLE